MLKSIYDLALSYTRLSFNYFYNKHFRKKALIKEHAIEYSSTIAFLNVLFSIPLLFFINYNNLKLLPLLLLFFITMLSAFAFISVAKSTRHMEISSVSPMLNLSVGITAILSFFILGETLTIIQILGIVMLIIGSYILQTHKNASLLEPIKNFSKSKYVHILLIAIFLYGITSVYDRFALFNYNVDPLAYLTVSHVFISLHLIFIMIFFHDGVTGIKKGLKTMRWLAILISLLTVIDRILHVFAVKLAYIGLVIAVKRSSSFFTILMAGELFHEKNIARKLFASLILITGVILIALK